MAQARSRKGCGKAMSSSSSLPRTPSSETDDGWTGVVNDFLMSSQEESDQAQEAEACRSETCSCGSGVAESDCSKGSSLSCHQPQPVGWWAQLVKMHTSSFGIPKQHHDVTVLSACAGIFTEGEALKAIGNGMDGLWQEGLTVNREPLKC